MGRQNRLYGVAGIDEAGRGPLIGPLVICGILMEPETLTDLEKIGAKDSKTLSPSRRQSLNQTIRSLAHKIELRTISASDIDKLRRGTTLNEIEVSEFASVAKSLRPQKMYLDAADVKEERFGKKVGEISGLADLGVIVISEHRADSKYPIVSAASIVAKVERDRIIEEFHLEYGAFGSGYPSDPKTIAFVKDLIESGTELPPIVRKSWDSVRKIRESVEQSTLDSF